MNKSDISQYVAGKTEPSQHKLVALATALQVSEAWLMGFEVPRERQISIEVTQEERFILTNFQLLNATGKQKAIDYVTDLADNPKYQRADRVCEPAAPYVPSVLAAHHETGLPDDEDMERINAAIDLVGKLKREKGEL